MSIKETNVETVPLTIELAKHWDRMRTLNGDRDPDSAPGQKRVAELHATKACGLFHSPTWSCTSVKTERGKKYRIDGGHSSRMLAQCNGDLPENLSVTIHEFECDTIDDAICLYEQFNRTISTRSKTDLIKNRAAYIDELKPIASSVISRCLGGIRFYLRVHGIETRSGTDEILNLLHPHREFIAWAAPITEFPLLRHSGTIAAMMATWHKNPQTAAKFWNTVGNDQATGKNPANLLNRFLIQAIAERGHKKYPPEVYYAKAIYAWNAFYLGKDILCLKYHVGKMPKAI